METNIISNYNDLPIGKYLDICKLNDMDMEEIDMQVAIVSILSGMTEEEVLQLPIMEYSQLSAKTAFLSNPIPDSVRYANKYNVGKWRLAPVADIMKITTAQYIDFQTFFKSKDLRIVEILSCILVPEGGRYNDGYDVVEVQQAIREHLPTDQAFALFGFFVMRFRESIANSLSFSESELKKMKKNNPMREKLLKEVETLRMLLQTNGDGSRM